MIQIDGKDSSFFTIEMQDLKSEDKIIDRFTTLPSVSFSMMSGQTFLKKRGVKDVEHEKKRDTHFIVDNKSKFPIYFWIKVYDDKKKQKYLKAVIGAFIQSRSFFLINQI